MIRLASLIGILVAAAPALASATPGAPDTPYPSAGAIAATPPPREIGLGAVQLVAGYALEIGGLASLFLVGLSPKDLDLGSDMASLGMVVVVGPALAGGAVCGTGLLSRAYRGRCWPTLLGAYTGAAVGALLGIGLAPGSSSWDESAELGQAIYGVIGVLALAPIGALIGYHVSKETITPPAGDVSGQIGAPLPAVTAVAERSRNFAFKDPRPHLMLPIINLRW